MIRPRTTSAVTATVLLALIPGAILQTTLFGAGAITNYHSHAADVIQYAIGMETSAWKKAGKISTDQEIEAVFEKDLTELKIRNPVMEGK